MKSAPRIEYSKAAEVQHTIQPFNAHQMRLESLDIRSARSNLVLNSSIRQQSVQLQQNARKPIVEVDEEWNEFRAKQLTDLLRGRKIYQAVIVGLSAFLFVFFVIMMWQVATKNQQARELNDLSSEYASLQVSTQTSLMVKDSLNAQLAEENQSLWKRIGQLE